jgi:nucleoid-associated protein
MLSQNISHVVDVETLTLQRSLSLKTEQLDLAARIRIGEWLDGNAAPVSLVRGKKEVSDYFKAFIGLHQPHSNTDATHKIMDFADKWLDDKNISTDERQLARTRVLDYVKNIGDKPVELHAIAGLVDPIDREAFITSANDAGIDAEFYIDGRSLKAWKKVQFKDKDVNVIFSKNLINTRVVYDADNHTLLIKNVNISPEDLR